MNSQTSATDFEPLILDANTMRRLAGRQNEQDRGMQGLLPLLELARIKTGNHFVVEVGTWAGQNAIDLHEDGFNVFCVDTWEGTRSDFTGAVAKACGGRDKVLRVFCRNVGYRLHEGIVPCVGTSEFWASVWKKPICGVFIDADHEYEAVNRDIDLWWPHVPEGGILCGHDIASFEGVQKAVMERFPECAENVCNDLDGWEPNDVAGTINNVWYRWKTNANNGRCS